MNAKKFVAVYIHTHRYNLIDIKLCFKQALLMMLNER